MERAPRPACVSTSTLDDADPLQRIRYHRHDASVFLYAFDLVELNGDDLRRETFETRKATLASVLAKEDRREQFDELDRGALPLMSQTLLSARLKEYRGRWPDHVRSRL